MSKPSFWKFLRGITSISLQIYGIYLLFAGDYEGALYASVTFGDTSAPSDVTTYLDSLFSQSLPFYKSTIVDNIGAGNAFLFKIVKGGLYEAYEGGTDIRENLMYEYAPSDWYDGYDELPDTPTDGITQSIFEARQQASPITYSMKEVIQNKRMLNNLVKTKIMQSELGIQEGFAQALMWGAGEGAFRTPKIGATGALAIEPIWSLIDYTPTTSRLIGNINQSTSTWWRNVTKTSSATTYDGFLAEWLNFHNTCALGSGGPPDLYICDQVTWELAAFALYQRYRNTNGDDDFPFTNIKVPFGGRPLLVMDEKVPDIDNQLKDTSAGGGNKGTMLAINSKFFRMRYIPERDFDMILNESGKAFVKPIKGDSRLAHIGWMGSPTITNRRKHGVWGDIARTLTVA